jgi:hypothetical protein
MDSGTQKILQERSILKTAPLKRIVRNNIDYSGQELFLEISQVHGPSGPFRWTIHNTSMHFEQKLWQMHISSTNRSKERKVLLGAMCGLSGLTRGPSHC